MIRSSAILPVALLLAGCDRVTTYAEGCGPLPNNWITPRQGRGILSNLNVISVSADKAVTWNGEKISRDKLRSYLEFAKAMTPPLVTQVKFDPKLDCDTVAQLRQEIAQKLDCSYGLCAEGHGRWWFIGDVGPPFVAYDPHPELPPEQ